MQKKHITLTKKSFNESGKMTERNITSNYVYTNDVEVDSRH